MVDLLPTRDDEGSTSGGESDAGDGADGNGTARVVDIESDDAGDLLDALSSETARSVLATLHEEPSTPSEVAEAVDTSLQNAQYHLDNLEEAGAIEVIDTAYSEKGREMRVYGPAEESLVLYAGREETGRLRRALRRLVAGLAGLGLASLVVQALAGGGGGGGGGAIGTADATSGAGGVGAVPPGVLFFAGGAAVLLAWVAWGYVRG